MEEDLEENRSVNYFCLLFYTFLVATFWFWIGTLFRSYWGLPNNFERECSPQLRSHLAFLSISEYIRRKLRANDLEVQNEAFSSLMYENSNQSPTRIELQRNILIHSILECYIFPWYNRISDQQAFPEQFKFVLQIAFNRLKEKVQKIDRTVLAKEVIQIVHSHWKEYCLAVEKQTTTNESIVKNFKFNHDCVTNAAELSKEYESLVYLLLKDLLTQELNCNIFRQFLSGILVKCFVMYYTNLASEPRWVNKMLIAIISKGSFQYEGESSTRTPPSPLCLTTAGLLTSEAIPDKNSPKAKSNEILFNEAKHEGPALDQLSLTPEQYSSDSSLNSIKNLEMTKTPEGARLENFSDIFNMEIPGSPRFKKKGSTTISAALGEILSSTALPLLPEGYAYQVPDAIESKNKILPQKLFDNEKSESSSGEVSTSADSNKGVRFSYDNMLTLGEVVCRKDSAPILTKPNDSSVHIHSRSRHYSLNDYGRAKNNADENTTSSLDETKRIQPIVRQHEFECETSNSLLSEEDKETSRLNKESEDFAATIAKLRSLLEQRESQNNLMEFVDDENGKGKTADSTNSLEDEVGDEALENKLSKTPVCKMKSSPQIGKASNILSDAPDSWTGSLETEKLNRIVNELEESEAEVNCFFLNVLITKTEFLSDTSAQSTLYCIQYQGVYLDCEREGQPQKFVLRTTTVKRRFKDFLTLQTQLEGNPIWKPHLKGMKTPKKWLHISFTNQNAVSQRRAHLEHYLQQLCYHPVLGFCKELRQFMAYGEDGYQAFGIPPSELVTTHKFEKLAKTFSEVFNTLRDAVPHFEFDGPATVNSLDGSVKSPPSAIRKKMIPSFLHFEKLTSEGTKVSDPTNSKTAPVTPAKQELDAVKKELTLSDPDVRQGLENEKSPCMTPSPNPMTEYGNEYAKCFEDETVEQVDSIYPVATSMVQLICDVLWLPQHKPNSASVSAFMAISGKSLENYLQESMDLFLCEEAITGYLDTLTTSLHEWSQQPEGSPTKSGFDHDFNRSDLKDSFKQKIPVWIRWMWGRGRSEETIDRLVGFLQYTELNHDLILSVSELIFLKLIDSSSSSSN